MYGVQICPLGENVKKEKNIVYVGKVLRQDNWITPSLLCIKWFF